MPGISRVFLLMFFVVVAMAQSPEPPLSDTRLSIHTLVREDIFAGYLSDNMERFARGEKNIDALIEKRPDVKSELLAWKGGAKLYRAVIAYENKRTDEFQKQYQQALDIFSQARQLSPQNGGAAAVIGGSYVILADRLPKEYRAPAWAQAYEAYHLLWKQQAPAIEKLPVHLRGELLGGLAQSSQRTGHVEETTQYLDKILTILPGTPYESVAKKWKENPTVAASTSITCLNCHESGRLAARLASLSK